MIHDNMILILGATPQLTNQLIMDVAQVKHRNISVDVNKRNK